MSIISSNLYKALLKAGVPEVEAEKASAEVAESNKTVSELKQQVKSFSKDNDNKFELLRKDSDLLRREMNTKFNLVIGLLVTVVAGMILNMFNFFPHH